MMKLLKAARTARAPRMAVAILITVFAVACASGGGGDGSTAAGASIGGLLTSGGSAGTTTTSSSTGSSLSGTVTTIPAVDDAGPPYATYVAVGGDGTLYAAEGYYVAEFRPDGGRFNLVGSPSGVNLFADGGGPFFPGPGPIAVDSSGLVYSLSHYIFKITPAGSLSVLVGDPSRGYVDGPPGVAGIYLPAGISVDREGNCYLLDTESVRKVLPDGTVSTLAGGGQVMTQGDVDGKGGVDGGTSFNDPQGIAVDTAGNCYVADEYNNLVRKVAPDGTTTTLAGNELRGHTDGSGGRNGQASFNRPQGVAVDAAGNVYVADTLNNTIRKILPDGTTSTLAGDARSAAGLVDGPVATARFSSPSALAVAPNGDIYVADLGNLRIRIIHH